MKKAFSILVGLAIIIIAAMFISYHIAINSLEPLTDEARRSLPGSFIKLRDGYISYYWKGPSDGNIVVLVHGLSTPKFVWRGNVDTLTAAGNRVLAFDHLGRGFSDRPDVVYDAEYYDRELLELLDGLKVTDPVDLVGYSMGGGIVTGFAARHPERIKKLILIAPAGYIPKYNGLASLVLIPVLGDWLMAIIGKRVVMKAVQKEIESGTAMPNMVALFEEQLKYRGYLPSILSTMRHYPMHNLSSDYEAVGRTDIPTWAIWGTADSTVPFKGSIKVKQAIPQATIIPVEGAKHSVTFARTKQINQILVDILQE